MRRAVRRSSALLSADGKVLAFTSWASNLVLQGFNQRPDAFVASVP
jgi:hypothetical protein